MTICQQFEIGMVLAERQLDVLKNRDILTKCQRFRRVAAPAIKRTRLSLENHSRGTNILFHSIMGIYKVRNLREGDRPGNWLRYWENATGLKADECHNILCSNKATDGAHVQLVDSSNKKWYIVPLCHECNCQFGAELTVTGPLVSATDPNDILW